MIPVLLSVASLLVGGERNLMSLDHHKIVPVEALFSNYDEESEDCMAVTDSMKQLGDCFG